jgi:two-component sensor histidine kinase
VLSISDDGAGIDGDPESGTGLSIVSALVRDELGGTLALDSNGVGLRAVVTFPA